MNNFIKAIKKDKKIIFINLNIQRQITNIRL